MEEYRPYTATRRKPEYEVKEKLSVTVTRVNIGRLRGKAAFVNRSMSSIVEDALNLYFER